MSGTRSSSLEPLWEELFPAEQARIIRLLVERVEIGPRGADIRLRVEGLASLARDLAGPALHAGGRLSTPSSITVRVPLDYSATARAEDCSYAQ